MYALVVVASLLATLSLASHSIVGRQTPESACMTSDQNNFTLLAITESLLSIRHQLALGSNVSSSSNGTLWIGVSSLLPSATIALIRHIFRRA